MNCTANLPHMTPLNAEMCKIRHMNTVSMASNISCIPGGIGTLTGIVTIINEVDATIFMDAYGYHPVFLLLNRNSFMSRFIGG